MRKSNSKSKYTHSNIQHTVNDSRGVAYAKNKTTSTIVHTQTDPQQQTTKKNSINKVSSCARIASSCKSSKTNLIKIETRNSRVSSGVKNACAQSEENLHKKNQQLVSENKVLKE